MGRSGTAGAAAVDATAEGAAGAGVAGAADATVVDDPAAPALSHGFGGAAGIMLLLLRLDDEAGQPAPVFPDTGQATLRGVSRG